MFEQTSDSEEIVIRRIQRRLERYLGEIEKNAASIKSEFGGDSGGTKIVNVQALGNVLEDSRSKEIKKEAPKKELKPPPPPPKSTPPQPIPQRPLPPPPPPPVVENKKTSTLNIVTESEKPFSETKDVLASSVEKLDAEPKKPVSPQPPPPPPLPPPPPSSPLQSELQNLPMSTPPEALSTPPASKAPQTKSPKKKDERGVSSRPPKTAEPELPIDDVVLSGQPTKTGKTRAGFPTRVFFLAFIVALVALAAWYHFTGGDILHLIKLQ